MGGIRATEDRPTPKAVYNYTLYLEAFVISLGAFLFGYDSAFIGTTIARKSFVADFGITAATKASISSNITSAFQAGAFWGAIITWGLTEKWGRKWALQLNVIVFIIGAILMTVTPKELSYIYAGRTLTGGACGGITATVPSYLAELSISSIRGIMTGFFELTYQVGSVIGFWLNFGINQNMDVTSSASWRLPMGLQLAPAVPLFVGIFFIHESPLWLMRKGKEDRASKALVELRHLPVEHQYIQEELATLRARLSEEEAIARKYGEGPWALFRGAMHEFAQPGMRNRVFLIFCAFCLQNLSGAAAINYYSPTLFGSLGVTDVAFYTGIYGLVKAIASMIYYVGLIDLVGRRRPVIISSLACSICLWIVGAYVKIGNPAAVLAAKQQLSPSTAAGGRMAIGMIMIYSTFWSFGLNGVPWILAAEIFPGALRNFSGTFAALVQWAVQFIMTKALPYIFVSFGFGTWFFFAGWMLVASMWAYLVVPETKGLTIDQMDLIFGARSAASGGAAAAKGFRIPRTKVTNRIIAEQKLERVEDGRDLNAAALEAKAARSSVHEDEVKQEV